jgi:hypothetical protein
MTTHFVIPIGGKSLLKDFELKYMLRSLEQYYTDDFDVYILSDREIPCIQKACITIVPRYYPEKALKHWNGIKNYENYFDVLNKLKIATEILPEREFVWIYDDVLLIDKIDHRSFWRNIALYKDKPDFYLLRKKTKWSKTINVATDLAAGVINHDMYVYETHIPRLLYSERLISMFNEFDFNDRVIPYAPSTLYFNLFYDIPDVILEGSDIIKVGFYGEKLPGICSYNSTSLEEIEEAVVGKTWINYNDAGIGTDINSSVLAEYIKNKFPNKSIFEK